MGIFRIKDRWYIDYYYHGRRIRKSVGNKRDARNVLSTIKADILREEYGFRNKPEIRFEKFAKEYVEYAKVNKKSWERDVITLSHLMPHLKGIMLSRITPKDIESYKLARLRQVKSSTVNRELTLIKFMFSLAVKWKYVNSNPVKEVRFLKEQEFIIRVLNNTEARNIIKFASPRLKPVIIIGLNTGMRKGEILNLRWNDIDFDKKFIFIKESKSGRTRIVPMSSLVIDTLRKIKKEQIHENEYVFYDPQTKDCKMKIRSPFKSARNKAGMKNLRFHDLRHSAATWMVEAGIDLVTVKEILGHSNIETTLRYAHPTPENKLKAIRVLEEVLGWSKYGQKLK